MNSSRPRPDEKDSGGEYWRKLIEIFVIQIARPHSYNNVTLINMVFYYYYMRPLHVFLIVDRRNSDSRRSAARRCKFSGVFPPHAPESRLISALGAYILSVPGV